MKDRIKGKAEEVEGKLTDDKVEELKGKAEEVEGKLTDDKVEELKGKARQKVAEAKQSVGELRKKDPLRGDEEPRDEHDTPEPSQQTT